MGHEAILKHIQSLKIVKKSKQFQERAVNVLRTSGIANLISGRVATAIESDNELSRLAGKILTEHGVEDIADMPQEIMSLLAERVTALLDRESFPDLDSLCEKIVASIAQDTRVSTILNSP